MRTKLRAVRSKRKLVQVALGVDSWFGDLNPL